MRTLYELMNERKDQEPDRNQPGFLHGQEVTIQCALDRTAVIVRDGEPARLALLTEVHADGRRLRWVTKEDAAKDRSRERGRRLSLASKKRQTKCSVCQKDRTLADLQKRPGRKCDECWHAWKRQRSHRKSA